jgi:hypothetical protein
LIQETSTRSSTPSGALISSLGKITKVAMEGIEAAIDVCLTSEVSAGA